MAVDVFVAYHTDSFQLRTLEAKLQSLFGRIPVNDTTFFNAWHGMDENGTEHIDRGTKPSVMSAGELCSKIEAFAQKSMAAGNRPVVLMEANYGSPGGTLQQIVVDVARRFDSKIVDNQVPFVLFHGSSEQFTPTELDALPATTRELPKNVKLILDKARYGEAVKNFEPTLNFLQDLGAMERPAQKPLNVKPSRPSRAERVSPDTKAVIADDGGKRPDSLPKNASGKVRPSRDERVSPDKNAVVADDGGKRPDSLAKNAPGKVRPSRDERVSPDKNAVVGDDGSLGQQPDFIAKNASGKGRGRNGTSGGKALPSGGSRKSSPGAGGRRPGKP